MKKSSSGTGNKGRNINSLKTKAPDRHDDNQRRQPPTPQDIARVQPISQNNTDKNHPAKDTRSGKGSK